MRTVAAALLCFACTPLPATRGGAAPPTSPAPAPGAMAAIERDVFAEINRLRTREGASAMQRNAALDQAARAHAQELAARRTLDHNSTDPELRTPGMRATAAGVTWSSIAENLASMSGAAASVGAQTGSIWMNSSGHRNNLLNARYTHTGVGVAVDDRGVWYVTQLYVLPRATR